MKLGRVRVESSEGSKSSAVPSKDITLQPAAKRFSAMEPSKGGIDEDLTNIPPSPAYVLSFSFSKRLDEKIARMEAEDELPSKTTYNVDDVTDNVTRTRKDSYSKDGDDDGVEEEGSKASSKVSEGVVKQAILSLDFKDSLAKSVRETDLGEDFIARSIEDPGFLTSSLNDPKFVKKNPSFVAKIKGLISVATGKVFGKSKKKKAVEKPEEKKKDDDSLFDMDDVKGMDSAPMRSTVKLAAVTTIQKQPKLGKKFLLRVVTRDVESDNDDDKDPLSASMGSSALKAALADFTPSSPTASSIALGSPSLDPAIQFKALTDTALLKYDAKGKPGTRFMTLMPATREIVWSKKRAKRTAGKGARSMQLEKLQKVVIGPRSGRFAEVDWISRKPWLFCTLYDGEQTLDIEFNNDFQMSAWFDAFRTLATPGVVPSPSKVRWQKATIKILQDKLKAKAGSLRKLTT